MNENGALISLLCQLTRFLGGVIKVLTINKD